MTVVTLVRPGDVYILPIPGDNGETKDRFCVVLDCYPTATAAQLVSIIFGCSETKRGARNGEFVRIETAPASLMRALGLMNPTTFHLADIRCHDARSPRLDRGRRRGYCPPTTMLALRRLAELRNLWPDPPPLLPDKARDEAKQAASAWHLARASDDESR